MKTMNIHFSLWVKRFLCIIFVMMPCVGLTASSQESYLPMLKDGRVWKCMEVYLGGFGEDGEEKNDTVIREYRIDGTSVIDGRICHNLCLGSKVIGHYYEEGPQVYRYFSGNWELVFDFSLTLGQSIPYAEGTMKVKSVSALNVKGTDRRFLFFGLEAYDRSKIYWIEGIGGSDSGPYIEEIIIGSFLYSKLLSVYDGDTCIFEAKDIATSTGINISPRILYVKRFERSIYDLQGRRLAEKPAKRMYIKDRRKYVR